MDYLTRLDPRSKMLFTVFIITGVLLVDRFHFIYLLSFIGFLLFLTIFSGKNFTYYIVYLLKIYPMIFLITFLLPFQSAAGQSDKLIVLKQFNIYKSGILNFTIINLKYIAIVLCTLLWTTTTPLDRIIKGFEILGIPDWFLSVMTFMMRMIYLLKDEIGKMHRAFQSRYISLPYFSKVKILAQMSGIYFVRVVGRSEQSYSSMISRGFTGRCPSSVKLNWQFQDSLLTFSGFLFTALILILQ